MRTNIAAGVAFSLLLPGCLAHTAYEVVATPVRVAGAVVHGTYRTVAGPSQAEKDRRRGKAERKADKAEAKRQAKLKQESS